MATPCHPAWQLVPTTQDHQELTDHEGCFQEDFNKTGRGRPWICQVSHHHVRGANAYYTEAAWYANQCRISTTTMVFQG